MSTTHMRVAGFVSYREAVEDIANGGANGTIVAYPLTSLPSGATVMGGNQTFKDMLNFSSGGMECLPTSTASALIGLKLPAFTAAQISALNRGGHFAFDVTSNLFDISRTYSTSQNSIYRGAGAGGTPWCKKGSGSSQILFDSPSTITPSSLPQGKPDTSRIVVSWNNGYLSLYVNGGLISPVVVKTSGMDFNNFYLGGDGVNGGGPWGVRYSNFHISTQLIMLPVHKNLGEIAMLGHSFVTNGGYVSSTLPNTHRYISRSGSGYATETGTYDVGTSYAIHRKIGCAGFTFGNQISNYGISGSLVSSLSVQVASLVATRRNVDYIIINSGINNVVANTGAITGSPDAEYRAAIDAIFSAYPNIRKIYVCNLSSGKMTTDRSNAACTSAIASINTIITNLPVGYADSDASRIEIVDQFNLFGGDAYDPQYFGVTSGSDLHPNSTGYDRLGNHIGDLIVSDL